MSPSPYTWSNPFGSAPLDQTVTGSVPGDVVQWNGLPCAMSWGMERPRAYHLAHVAATARLVAGMMAGNALLQALAGADE